MYILLRFFKDLWYTERRLVWTSLTQWVGARNGRTAVLCDESVPKTKETNTKCAHLGPVPSQLIVKVTQWHNLLATYLPITTEPSFTFGKRRDCGGRGETTTSQFLHLFFWRETSLSRGFPTSPLTSSLQITRRSVLTTVLFSSSASH